MDLVVNIPFPYRGEKAINRKFVNICKLPCITNKKTMIAEMEMKFKQNEIPNIIKST